LSYTLIQRLTLIRDEYDAAQASVTYAKRVWSQIQTEAEFDKLKFFQVRQASTYLEATYTVRLFSTFEAVLRDVLHLHSLTKADRRSAYDLINRSASKWRIASSVRDEAHRVREFRNIFVHRNEIAYPALSFTEALGLLNRFLAWLPNSL